MIRRLHGTIATLWQDGVILDVQGVGYEVWLAPNHIHRFSAGQTATISIYTHVKEEALQLFGFSDENERELFMLLLSVSGVGPKTALQVIGYGVSQIVEAIRLSNVAFFQSVPRLGKKTAQKIVVELQGKVGGEGAVVFAPPTPLLRDLEEALLAMGHTPMAIQAVLQKVPDELELEAALRWALQELRPKRT